MAIRSFKDVVDAYAAGRVKYSAWRKIPYFAQGSSTQVWCDLETCGGSPLPLPYSGLPLKSVPLARSTHGGIDHGESSSPYTKYLHKLTIFWPFTYTSPSVWVLLDYLLYYPAISENVLTEQTLDNSGGAISRYTDGEGVQLLAVITSPHTGNLQTFRVRYTNSEGVADRWTQSVTMQSASLIPGIVLTYAGATLTGVNCLFLPLQEGDTGVRSAQGVLSEGVGDTGQFTLLLVKPLVGPLRCGDAPSEFDFFQHFSKPVAIAEDACLGFVYHALGNTSGTNLWGDATFIWG